MLAIVAVIWALRVPAAGAVEFLVILFFCGLSAGTIGKIKGSSFVLWFAVGFFLPLIGTIAALASRNERFEPTRECPECGSTVKALRPGLHELRPRSGMACRTRLVL